MDSEVNSINKNNKSSKEAITLHCTKCVKFNLLNFQIYKCMKAVLWYAYDFNNIIIN